MPRPFRWQRSVGSSAVTNGGRHRGVKLAERSSVHRHENRVLTTHSSSPAPQAISWIWMLPVTWQDRGQEAGVVPAGRLELGRDRRDVDVFPDLHRRADGQPIAVQRQAHRRLERAEVGVEVVPLVADHHQLARLVGRDQERGAQAAEQRREVGRVDGPQRRRCRRRRLRLSGVRRCGCGFSFGWSRLFRAHVMGPRARGEAGGSFWNKGLSQSLGGAARNARIRPSPFPARPGVDSDGAGTSSAMRVAPDPGLRFDDRQLVSAFPIDRGAARSPTTIGSSPTRYRSGTSPVKPLPLRGTPVKRTSIRFCNARIGESRNEDFTPHSRPGRTGRSDGPKRSGASGRAGGIPDWEGPRSSRCIALVLDGCMKARPVPGPLPPAERPRPEDSLSRCSPPDCDYRECRAPCSPFEPPDTPRRRSTARRSWAWVSLRVMSLRLRRSDS